jgi:hypothetical protein
VVGRKGKITNRDGNRMQRAGGGKEEVEEEGDVGERI